MLQVGVDCEKIARFRRLCFRSSNKFYRKIFTPQEIKYCSSYRDPYPRFAVRFAAKEAVIKALSGIAKPRYSEIVIQKDKNNKPKISINKNRFKKLSKLTISISLTHSDSYAVAFAVVTDNKSCTKQAAEEIARKGTSYIKKKIGG